MPYMLAITLLSIIFFSFQIIIIKLKKPLLQLVVGSREICFTKEIVGNSVFDFLCVLKLQTEYLLMYNVPCGTFEVRFL